MPVAKRARRRGDDAASRPAKEGDDAADATDKDCDDDVSLLGGDDEAAGSGDVARDLADVREELAVLEDSTEPYYKVNIRGGKWTFEHKKEVADCAQAVPRDAETRYWSIAYELPSSKSFSFRLYGRDSALALAREFCRRAIFASLYFDSVDDDFTYSPDHVARCGDDLDFVTWLLGLDDDDPAFAKGQDIRKIAPSVACGEL